MNKLSIPEILQNNLVKGENSKESAGTNDPAWARIILIPTDFNKDDFPPPFKPYIRRP